MLHPVNGLSIRVDYDIQSLLKVPTQFDLIEYSIQFNPPWLGLQGTPKNVEEIPIVTEGLPKIVPAYAVEVVPGSYTSVLVPMTPSYTFTGIVTDASGEAVSGARVEAVPTDHGQSIFSVTNGAGIFYLEGLEHGTYTLQINGQPAKPNIIKIDESSEPFQELNLQH